MASAAAPSSSAPAPFAFPREYYFPPFFTKQTNLNTLHAQMVKWSALVLAYCRHHRIFKLSLSGSSTSTSTTTDAAGEGGGTGGAGGAGTEELFWNRKIQRRLSPSDVREVVEHMQREGRAEYVGGGPGGDVVWVYWRTPEEWGALVEGWVEETGQKGSVLTLYELTEGEGTRGTEFHGMDVDLLQKALGVLVKRGKAQIFGSEDSQGVKFF